MPDLLRGRYELLEVVGDGGEGRVVKALDRQHDRIVALKIRTLVTPGNREATLSEARILLAVPPHEHLPLVREDFFEGDQYVIAMDWVDGTDLDRLLRARRQRGLAPSLVLQWLADVAEALTHLHGQDPPVVHGDVKPANLILTRGGRVSVVDFGLSSSPGSRSRRAGTPGYAAPELAAGGAPSVASDVYSLAATAFSLLTGGPPTGIRPAWTGIDPAQAAELEDAIRRGLATDPERRPSSAAELVEGLRSGWSSSLPTGVLTFCVTDIVGAAEMWAAEPAHMARALVRHDELVAAVVEDRGGRFLKSMGQGDSTVSVFASPRPACDAAWAVLAELAAVTWPGGLQLEARVGLHTGEAERRGSEYVGATLHVAAQVRDLARSGEVLLSPRTAALVGNHLPSGVGLVDLGPHRLAGGAEQVSVFALTATDDATAPGALAECPYPGLPAFTAQHADRFFGREDVVADIVRRMTTSSFVAIVGSSGSGKSSVVRAGLVPALGGADVITPGRDPIGSLPPADTSTRPLLVDQFEQLFSLCDDERERAAFVERLLDWPQPVAIALRADWYGACAGYPALAAAVAREQVLLGPMADEQLRRAITAPAALAALRLEPGFVDVLATEVAGEPGALPLLSHALRATWERRDSRTLTLEGYRSTGGVRGAIARTADDALDALAPEDRDLARWLFVRLVEPGDGAPDAGRRAQLDELTGIPGDEGRLATVLDALAAARLVTLDGGAVEVAHEALIREWPLLRRWLDEDRDGLRMQRHLTTAAGAWDAMGRDPAELYRGPRLATALDWLATARPHVSVLERSFLDASDTEQRRAEDEQVRSNRRLRGLLRVTAVVLVVAVAAGSVAFVQGRRASAARDSADVARIAAVSQSVVDRQPGLGLLLGAEAFRRLDSFQSRGALLAALEAHPLLDGLLHAEGSGLEAVVFSPDGATIATPTSDGSGTILWETSTRRRAAVLRHERDISLAAAVSPDGRWLAVPAIWESADDFGSRLQIWDLRSRRLDRVVASPAGGLTTAAFSPDGRQLITQGGPTSAGSFPTLAVVWDTATWTPIGDPWTLSDEYVGDRTVVVSPDGTMLAVPGAGGTVQVWRVGDRRPAGAPLAPDVGRVTSLAFSPDATLLAIGGAESRVVLVDPLTGGARPALPLSDSEPSAAEFSPDGRILAVADVAGTTQLFDVATGAELGPPLRASASSINDVSFSADGTHLATGGLDRTGAVWNLDGRRSIGDAVADHDAEATDVEYTPDGRTLVSSGSDGVLTIREVATGRARHIHVGGELLAAALDATGAVVAVGGTTGRVETFGVGTGAPGPTFAVGDAWIYDLAFSPTTGALAVAVGSPPGAGAAPGEEGYVVVVDPRTGGELGPRVSEVGGFPVGLAWSPDGAQLAVTADNQVLRFYRGAPPYPEIGDRIDSPDSEILAAAFSPDGTRLATGTGSGIVQQWSSTTHREIGTPLKGHTGAVGGLAYSPDGTMLASTTLGFSTTRLWETTTGAPIGAELTAGRTPYTAKTFLLEHFQGSRPAFRPTGAELSTPAFDGTVVTWDLRPAYWLAAACGIVGRSLSRAEWAQNIAGRPYRRTCPG